MQALTIATNVRTELSDDDKTTWSDADLLSYMNSAQKMVVLVRPDANSVSSSLLLTPGETKHSLASGDLRLLGVTRNLGSDGSTPGRPIRMIESADQDLFNQSWHTAVGKASIDEVMLNEKVPTQFYTNPPAHATTPVYIETEVSRVPTELTDIDTDPIAISDIYEQPIRQFMLHLAYAVEVESVTSTAKSRGYLQDFYNSLGIKTKVDAIYSPSREVRNSG